MGQVLVLRLSLLLLLGGILVDCSFVTKVNNGFERVVVSVDEHLALPQSPSFGSSSSSFSSSSSGSAFSTSSSSSGSSSAPGGTGPNKGATHECQAVLEQLKELISRTSDLLYKTTNGQTYFRQVSIVLPSDWATSNCTGLEQEVSTATYQTSSSADITLTGDHPVFIDKPWTLQYGPCGAPGKKIQIPLSFLREESELKARLMLREWIKFRYGVFDENGYAHDEKYPADYVGPNGKLVQTACHLNRSSGCSDPEKCEKAHKSGNNLGAVAATSVMSLPLDPNHVNEFCNEASHIRTTPTKHNFLCDGRSIWEVMKQHEDFTNSDDNVKNTENNNVHENQTLPPGVTSSHKPNLKKGPAPPPVFSFVAAKSHRMIFLLDRSRAMNQNNRWVNLRRSLYRMFHYLPSGVELGVISYTNGSTLSLPLTVASTHNRDHLHGRIPLRPLSAISEDSACVLCALRAAIKLIKSSDENVGPTTLVLVNGSPSKLMTREWEKIVKIIDGTPLRVIVITYTNESAELVQLAQYGRFYKIPDGQGNNLEQNEFLNNVFVEIISENVGTPLNKVFETVHWPDSDWQSRGKFTIEDSLGRNTWVTVTTEELGDVDGLQLVSPTGKEFDLPLHAEGLVFLKIPGVSEAGIWSYVIKFYQNQSPRPISVDVITESRKSESISVKFWNQVILPSDSSDGLSPSDPVPLSFSAEVVLLYAQVLQGDLPVLNANVTATIILPGQPEHGPRSINVRLLDTGSGDPDITWGDGIYSTYFTQLGPNPGFFSLTVQIDDNNGQAVVPVHTNISRGSLDVPTCCGSSIPHIATIPTGSFLRKIAGPSFEIKQGVPFGDDPYPPGRVTDLRVERVVDSTSEVKLSWTAPGGDFDKGKASRYEIRCYTSREALMNDNFGAQGILVHSSLTPEPEAYGIRQSCTVGVPWSNEIFYYGIVSIDSALNRAKVSNLVSVLIKEAPTSTLKIVDAWEDDALVSNLTSSRSLSNRNEQNVFQAGATWFRGLNEVELYLIIGGAGAFLLLISTFILILVCVKRSKNKSSEAPPAYHNIYVGVGVGKGSGQAGSGNSGKDNKDKDKDPVGPLNCCWENESDGAPGGSSGGGPLDGSQPPKSMGGLSGPYLTDSASSYIPASALCGPTGNIYRDMYTGGSNSTQQTHAHDSSSVDSKHGSDGGSNETVHVTDGHNTPASFYSHNSHLNSVNSHVPIMSPNGGPGPLRGSEYNPSDDDEGGFKANPHLQGFHKVIPMPGSDYDSPSIINGSTYGGSIMSIPSNNKKRTRHISFV